MQKILLLFIALALIACNPNETPTPPSASVDLSATTTTPTFTPKPVVSPTSIASPTQKPEPTPTPSPSSPTPTTNAFTPTPLADFPLSLGTTWVYSATHYDTYDTERITATYIITETIVDTQTRPPYFATQIVQDTTLVTPSDNLAGKDWQQHYLAGPGGSNSFWYVISGTQVYEQTELDWTEIISTEATLAYIFPLTLGDRWYPDPWQRQEFPDFEVFPGTRTVYDLAERQVPAGTFQDCFEIITFYNGGSPRSWFCPGLGTVEREYHHVGTPFGHITVLISFSIPGSGER
jgi:hypothetical protein